MRSSLWVGLFVKRQEASDDQNVVVVTLGAFIREGLASTSSAKVHSSKRGEDSMAWRFRKSFSPIPGVRLTLTPRGLTTSVGVGPLRVSSGPSGAAFSASIPGTGLSFRQALGTSYAPHGPGKSTLLVPFPDQHQIPPTLSAPAASGMTEIKSAGSQGMTSEGLQVFKDMLTRARAQHAETSRDLTEAKESEARDVGKHKKWAEGYILRHLMKKRFASITTAAQDASAFREELQMQLDLSRLDTQFDIPDEVAKAFSRLSDDFAACSRSQRIWDNVAHRATNKNAERTSAARIVDLKIVAFKLGHCDVILAPMAVPCLQNANGGDLYLYPGFLLYLASATNFALIETAELDLSVERMRFIEADTKPSDAVQVGTTWAKTNLDGTRDKRFKENYEIPVMEYAKLTLKSALGLNEEYMLSNVAATEAFGRAWVEMKKVARR